MSEIELYGLMAIAQEHQKTAERAAKTSEAATAALAQAVAMHKQAAGELSKTAQDAITAAIRGQSAELLRPMEQAANRLEEARSNTAAWIYPTVFFAGVLVGIAVHWWASKEPPVQMVPIEAVIDYVRENPKR